ncbi:NifB/NifX family molybdenum-iron cluster-binding protein [Spirochaetota bacterium]
MKISITSHGKELNSNVDERFGRAQGFIIFDDETKEFKYIDNSKNLSTMQGAGIQSAKCMIDEGVQVLITGHVGPKAFTTLEQGDIRIMIGAEGKVEQAIDDYKKNKLKEATGANVKGHW